MDAKKTANKILEMIDEGIFNPRAIALMCLKWMSDDDIAEMAKANDLDLEFEDETEEPAPYILFAGETKDSLYPIKAFRDKAEAIADAKETAKLGCPCAEVCYMPEDDMDENKVVWSNCGRK